MTGERNLKAGCFGVGREVTLAEDGDAVLPIEMWQQTLHQCCPSRCGNDASVGQTLLVLQRSGGSASGSSGKAGERSINSPSANANTITNTKTKYKYKKCSSGQAGKMSLNSGSAVLQRLCAANCTALRSYITATFTYS